MTAAVMVWLEIVAEAALLLMVLWRRAWRGVPFFTAYVAWWLASDVVELLLSRSAAGWESRMLIEGSIGALLQLGVLIEAGWSIAAKSEAGQQRGALLWLAVLVIATGLALWPLTTLASSAPMTSTWLYYEQLLMTMAMLSVVCCVILLLFWRTLALSWRSRGVQVIAGLGMSSAPNVLLMVFRAHAVTAFPGERGLEWASSAVYCVVLGWWIWCVPEWCGASDATE